MGAFVGTPVAAFLSALRRDLSSQASWDPWQTNARASGRPVSLANECLAAAHLRAPTTAAFAVGDSN